MRRAGLYAHAGEDKAGPSREVDLENGSPSRQPAVASEARGKAAADSKGHERATGFPLKGGETARILVVMLVVVLLLNAGNLMGVGQYLIHEEIQEGDHEALLDLRKSEVRDHQEVHELESTVKSLKDELEALKGKLKDQGSRSSILEMDAEEREQEMAEQLREQLKGELEEEVMEKVEELEEEVQEKVEELQEQVELQKKHQRLEETNEQGLSNKQQQHPEIVPPKPIEGVHRHQRDACNPDCQDREPDCQDLARDGSCATQPQMMESACRLTCGICQLCAGETPPQAQSQDRPRQGWVAATVQPGTFYVYNETASGGEACRERQQCYHAEAWVTEHLTSRGLRRVRRWAEAEIIWTFSAEYGYNLTFIKSTQLVNHVGNTFQLLADKSQLFPTVKAYNKRAGCTDSGAPSVLPLTVDVRDEEQCSRLLDALQTEASHQWLLKPKGGSGGSGIRLFQSNQALRAEILAKSGGKGEGSLTVPLRCRRLSTGEPDVAQAYITNTLLLKGMKHRKFNLRAYVLISSVEPFVAFMHRDGYAGSSMQQYNSSADTLATHLTGMHTQVHESSYNAEDRVHNWDSLADIMEDELGDNLKPITGGRPVREWLHEKLMRTLLWVLYAGRHEYIAKPGSFGPLAVDLLLDDNFHLWVLEVNAYPWMAWETEWGKRWMHGLVTEMLDIQLEVWEAKQSGRRLDLLKSPKKWKVLVNEDTGESLYPYNTCPAEFR